MKSRVMTQIVKRKRPALEVADIFLKHQEQFLSHNQVTLSQKRIMQDITQCRTPALGGHAAKCENCAHIEISYNSCRNRHCPKCQALNKARWLEGRVSDLLPVAYVHGVFTLPHELNELILHNKRTLLNGLFAVVNRTLQTFARDSKHGPSGDLGFTAVLHTWNQNLLPHYHLHCVIPSGVYQSAKKRWCSTQYRFLFPVKALSRVFRGKMVSFCRKAFNQNRLIFPSSIVDLKDPRQFSALLTNLMKKEWVVYAKHPFKSPQYVLDYLGRYTHRVAISNNRLLSMKDETVCFTVKDRKKGYQNRTCTLSAERFIKRFLCHELPSGFMRIRHFGFLGNAAKSKQLTAIRKSLGASTIKKQKRAKSTAQLMLKTTGIDINRCPLCKTGTLKMIDQFDGLFNKRGHWGFPLKAG